jgi:Mn2+/Fe2+ NRAMP family transporter
MLQMALGILTSVGGYLEAGSISTALQAGGLFRFELVWAILLGTICVAFLLEMSGRLAAVAKHALTDVIRERFGFSFHVWLLVAQLLLDLLVLTAEVGGASYALQLATGVSFRAWALPVAFVLWLLLWIGTFSVIENGVALLGLVTVAFVVGAVRQHPPLEALMAGIVPTVPDHDLLRYLFTGVSILGATISPYLISFYSSGAVEEEWDESQLRSNRLVAWTGMTFGSLVSIGVLTMAAMVLAPRGIETERYEQAAWLLNLPLGPWGFWLFVASLGIGCIGAALELSLDMSYIVAQGLGWNWGENLKPTDDARFAMVYTSALAFATIPILSGLEPVTLTMFSMALTVVILPVLVLPLVVIMNDERYLKQHRNGPVTNVAVVAITVLSGLLALVSIPLQVLGAG